MFRMQSTNFLKVDSSSESAVFSVPLWVSAQPNSTVLLIVTLVYIVGIYSEENFTLYTFDSNDRIPR